MVYLIPRKQLFPKPDGHSANKLNSVQILRNFLKLTLTEKSSSNGQFRGIGNEIKYFAKIKCKVRCGI